MSQYSFLACRIEERVRMDFIETGPCTNRMVNVFVERYGLRYLLDILADERGFEMEFPALEVTAEDRAAFSDAIQRHVGECHACQRAAEYDQWVDGLLDELFKPAKFTTR